MRFIHLALLACCAIAATAFTTRAETIDDIVTLAQRNVGEDVLLATVNNARNDFTLTAPDIIKLKNAQVPNSVITAMLKHHGAAVAAAPAPAPAAPALAPAQAPVAAAPLAEAPRTAIAGEGTLDIENLDDRAWSYRYEPAVKTIWIVPAAVERRGMIGANAHVSLRMNADTYLVRYSGQTNGATVVVNGNQKSQVLLTRVNTEQLEALYASVFENGEKRNGGRLVVLRENSAPAVRRDSQATPPSTEYVQPPTIVQSVPQTTVIYEDPVYVGPPPVVYAPRYYRYAPYYYYPRNTVNFGYFHGGHHSGVGLGLGFGF
jgi:hypothetical protein